MGDPDYKAKQHAGRTWKTNQAYRPVVEGRFERHPDGSVYERQNNGMLVLVQPKGKRNAPVN